MVEMFMHKYFIKHAVYYRCTIFIRPAIRGKAIRVGIINYMFNYVVK